MPADIDQAPNLTQLPADYHDGPAGQPETWIGDSRSGILSLPERLTYGNVSAFIAKSMAVELIHFLPTTRHAIFGKDKDA